MAVLDQENSKKFILGTEKDKYDFFLKATDLGRISDVRNEKKQAGCRTPRYSGEMGWHTYIGACFREKCAQVKARRKSVHTTLAGFTLFPAVRRRFWARRVGNAVRVLFFHRKQPKVHAKPVEPVSSCVG